EAGLRAFPAGAGGGGGAGARRDARAGRHALGCARRSQERGAAECHAQGRGACDRMKEGMGGQMTATPEPPWAPNLRYPDPAVQVLHPSFAKYRLPLASVERLAAGMRWSEGPVWFGDARCVLWSDIPNNRIMRWDEETGATTVYRKPSNNANGNTRDRVGRLVTCEHDARRVTRTEHDGAVTVICDRFEGK